MKKLIVATITTMMMTAGAAQAGCLNGSHAAAESQTPVVAAVDDADPRLLAKLKAQEDLEQLEKLIETPPTFN